MGGSTRSPGTKAAAATAAKAEWRRRISVAVNFAPVELRALVFVHQEVIGVRHLREFFRGFRIVRIPVGMQFLGKIAIGLLDIGLARIPRYPQNRIWISHLLPYCRSEEHTSELQSLMRISYAVFCLKKKTQHTFFSYILSPYIIII